MAKNYGVGYPERPLMSTLSDLLGIPHFTTSNGGTVRSDFLREVLTALGEDPAGLDKDGLIRACVQASGSPFDPTVLSRGATVTNAALQLIVDGVTSESTSLERLATMDVAMPQDLAVEFDPAEMVDARRRALTARATREGQDRFRTAVLAAYGQACALSGFDAVAAIEAAHITPYLGPRSNVVPNSLPLRADLHRLWDGGQLALHEESMTIILGPALRVTSYGELHGRPAVNLPRRQADRPSSKALAAHRAWCGMDR